MADPAEPFANNLAEQALHMARLRMKISGCFRTRVGTGCFAQMQGLIETAHKRERNPLDLLRLDPDGGTQLPGGLFGYDRHFTWARSTQLGRRALPQS